ncbi:MAG: BatA domain-containing protein [Candidatus Nealsonbacteria bacterium]|nr:BatA domain-containing protein [Candidatus Nealsonbacteria bacterium]
MLDFAFPNLFWFGAIPALGLIAVPVLIHLINMLRHRRVEWAAMEFLLLSQKKHRTWIILKQLLLLLLRMAAIAAVVFMLAQPRLPSEFDWLPGSTPIHHIVLLDDSYSMSDNWAGTSAFAEAKAVVRQIGKQASAANEQQTLSLLRFSRVGRAEAADMFEDTVNRDEFIKKLDGTVRAFEVSQGSVGPDVALKAIGQLMGSADDQRRIVYLVSDFRSREWNKPVELRKQLAELNDADAELHLINCVERQRPNLAITSLIPSQGLRVAGVQWKMQVSVKNFGTEPAKGVSVSLEEDGEQRPGETFREIGPGLEVHKVFEVNFQGGGPHEMLARLEGDAVEADNSRHAALDVASDVPVLLIDNPDAHNARFLDASSAPGGSVRTGITPEIHTPSYLVSHPLEKYPAIVLMNFDRLDTSAIEALEEYVRAGGGVAFFLGEKTRAQFINDELYRDGQGLFPAPLVGQTTLQVNRLERAPDLELSVHPIFGDLANERNPTISTVLIGQYFSVPESFERAADGEEGRATDSTTEVIARLRNGAPLVVERRFGEGRVLAFLTTAAPDWNNWVRNPSFPVVVQLTCAYLSQRPLGNVSRPVGAKLEVTIDPQQYDTGVSLLTPNEATAAVTIKATTTDSATATVNPTATVAFPETDVAGIYQAMLTRKPEGTSQIRRYAVNVDPEEGNLEALNGEQLADKLKGVDYRYQQAAAFGYDPGETQGENIWLWILALLVLLLIAEQILAWSISYHPKSRQAALAAGKTATAAAGGSR